MIPGATSVPMEARRLCDRLEYSGVGGQACASLARARPCLRWAGALSAWCSAAAVVWLARPRVRASRSRDGGAGNLGVGSRTAAPGARPRPLASGALLVSACCGRADGHLSADPSGRQRSGPDHISGGSMDFDEAARIVDNVPVPHISAGHGRVLYQHIREDRPGNLLELGTARGGSAVFIAAALEANGAGHLTSVDSTRWQWRDPTPREV